MVQAHSTWAQPHLAAEPIATLSTGASLSDPNFHTPAEAEEAVRSIRSLYIARRVAAKRRLVSWTVAGYHLAIDESSVESPVKATLRAMVEGAGGRHTTVDRATLCQLTGVRRGATITAHWQQARAEGLLASRQRWNTTSLHTFLIPGTDFSADETVWGEPKDGWHVWTPEEIAWWESLDGGERISPPWGDGRPPF